MSSGKTSKVKDLPSDLTTFLRKYRIEPERFVERGLEWQNLKKVADCYVKKVKRLEPTATAVLAQLRNVPEIHSLKMRLKDPEHLMEKIVRKSLSQPKLSVNEENYDTVVTDLIGIRALHLFKGDWHPIHDFITSTWDLHERPIAYVREGDGLLDSFKKVDCDVKPHPFGYRSIHYVIKSQPTKHLAIAEIQVRTIFEEGWSEIDHRIRYPYETDNAILGQFLEIFNRLSGGADEMGTFIQTLSNELKQKDAKQKEHEAALTTKEADLNKMIDRLAIAQKEKENLKKEVEELRKSSSISVFDGVSVVPGNVMGLYRTQSVFGLSSARQKRCSNCGSIYDEDSTVSASTISSSSSVFFINRDLCPKCRR